METTYTTRVYGRIVTLVAFTNEEDTEIAKSLTGEKVSNIFIGHSICNPSDEYDPKLGASIAKGRAEKNRKNMISKQGWVEGTIVGLPESMLSESTLHVILLSVMDNIKSNPTNNFLNFNFS